MRIRRPKGERKVKCSKCTEDNDRLPQRYCKKCHAENMKTQRQKKYLTIV